MQAPLTTIQGRLTGVVSQVATTGINTQFSAQGQVLRVGQVRLSGQQATNVGTTSIRAAGIGLFVLPKGQIVVSYSGASPITTRGNAPLNLAGSIIGGTGAYLHATGSFLGKVTYTNSARITVNFTLRLA